MSKRKSTSYGFTLVELLVVIGIIALLISILLPALTTARKSAIAVKCLSGERTIGQAFMMYGAANKGAIVPSMVWKDASTVDYWPFVLVTQKYLPDPHVIANGPMAAQNSVFVCPAVRDSIICDEASSTGATTMGTDGFERRYSRVLAPNTLVPTPEPVNNGANSKGAMIIDIGYGINGSSGTTGTAGAYVNSPYVPMQAISLGTAPILPGMQKMTSFRNPTRTPLLYDGSGWNPWVYPDRITGARHGKYNKSKQFTSGVCNVLFMDGHCEGIPRAQLPNKPEHITGTNAQMLNRDYFWNRQQN